MRYYFIITLSVILGVLDLFIDFTVQHEVFLEKLLQPFILFSFFVFFICGIILWYKAVTMLKQEGKLINPINLFILLTFNFISGYFFYYYKISKRIDDKS